MEGKLIGEYLRPGTVNLIDGNPLTNGFFAHWIGFDFGQPVSVSRIRYMSRSDGNSIYPDNQYELFYYDLSGWKSLGSRMTTELVLEYDNIPSNALLWLRNHTAGKEERIFTVKEGKVRFW